MATLETQKLDTIIASRRSLLVGGAALAATAVVSGAGVARAAVPAVPTDVQVLNFALNLEYLEAQFYTLATEGKTADKAATSPITITSGASTPAVGGSVTYKATSTQVPFVNASVQAYAFETALQERKHVNFLKSQLGSAAVAQPNIDLLNSFIALGTLIGVQGFDPFASGYSFLLGAFIFEDVGVTAYHGGAAFLSPTYLTAAAEIQAVEAYHAGLIRATLLAVDQGLTTVGGGGIGAAAAATRGIANVRATLDGTVGTVPSSTATGQDDFGLSTIQVPLNGTTQSASTILDYGQVAAAGSSTAAYNTGYTYIAFARTFQQVLNVVYASSTGAVGGFYPQGMNGDIK